MYFVSYSWTNQEPDPDVLQLVNNLRELGYDVQCDVMDIQNSSSINFFQMMAKNFQKAEKVIIILSSNYKSKADSFRGGVGSEFTYIISDITNNPNKYILVSFLPSTPENISNITPDFLKGREIIAMTSEQLKSSGELEKSKLLYRLTNTPEYSFSEIRKDKFVPTPTSPCTSIEDNSTEQATGFEMHLDSTSFFDFRIRSAFPGVRGLQTFDDPKICVDRLEILLREPLSNTNLKDPIWHFRGNRCFNIPSFHRLSDTKCLIDIDEYEIEKIGVYISDFYFRDFIYIQTKPDNPSGAYTYPNQNYLNNPFGQSYGYYYEEFGLYNDIPITRQEYDDGAAVINDKVIPSNGRFQLRVRYLTPYNLIICAKYHPFNSNDGDRITKQYLDGILKGTYSIEEFVDASLLLPNKND